MTNWNDPIARLRLIDSVGPDEYNRLFQQHMIDTTVSTVNGYPIRPVSSRWGRIFMVDGANIGYREQERAEAHARTLPPRA